jgi:nucleoside-diphosphate-sugar epimerase
MRFTIFGGHGFIGRALVARLAEEGHEISAPPRGAVIDAGAELGHVVYCIGLTADFRQRPVETIEAHVHTLTGLMHRARYQSWLYLSTTRLYQGLGPDGVGREDEPVPVLPSADTLYDLSKLLGEAYCLGRDDPGVRVARLSNVYGPGQGTNSFLGAVIDDLKRKGSVTIREDPLSSKDYISVGDVARILVRIALEGCSRVYNVARGSPTTHGEIAQALEVLTGGRINFQPGAPRRVFPRIDNTRIRTEFGATPKSLIDNLPVLLRM